MGAAGAGVAYSRAGGPSPGGTGGCRPVYAGQAEICVLLTNSHVPTLTFFVVFLMKWS